MLITHSYDPEATAPQRRWSAFVARLIHRGWDVDVVAPAPHPDRSPADAGSGGTFFRAEDGRHGERVHRVPLLRHTESRLSKLASNVLSSLSTVPRALVASMSSGRPDVVVVTVPALPNTAAGYLLSILWRRPLVVDMRDAWPDLARDAAIVTSRRPSVMEAVVTFVQRRAAAVVSVTEGFAELLRQRGCQRVEVVPNGLTASRLPRQAATAPALASAGKPSSAGEPLHVLYLGNHGESQGLDVLIDAAQLAGDSVRLRMVGTGTMKEELIERARAAGADVDFLEATHGEETLAQYDWADTAVVSLRDDWPSFERTIPSKTFELLAVSRHITAAVRGEASEVLRAAGGADVVAHDAEAMAELWQDLRRDPARLDVGTTGRRWVAEHRNLARLGDQFADLLADLQTQRNHA
nr:glycosyltransferase family 4 protein [Zhihengliuella flava]